MDASTTPPAITAVATFTRAVNMLLLGTAVIVLDVRLGAMNIAPDALDVLFDPLGQLIVLAGLVLLWRSTPRTVLIAPALGLGAVAFVLSLALELAVLDGSAAVGTIDLSTGGTALGTALFVAQALGIMTMAQHLRRVLAGIASDRWRQVTIAWLVSLALTPLVALTKAIELLLLDAAVVVVAAVLLLLSLLATRAHVRDGEGGGPTSAALDL